MADMDKYHIDEYGDQEVREYHDTPIPKFLMAIYIVLPIWGILWWSLYWDGSQGFLDRGFWSELEKAAGTRKVVEAPASPGQSERSSSSSSSGRSKASR